MDGFLINLSIFVIWCFFMRIIYYYMDYYLDKDIYIYKVGIMLFLFFFFNWMIKWRIYVYFVLDDGFWGILIFKIWILEFYINFEIWVWDFWNFIFGFWILLNFILKKGIIKYFEKKIKKYNFIVFYK